MRTITPSRLNLEPESYYKPLGTVQTKYVYTKQKIRLIKSIMLKFLKFTIKMSAKTFKLIKEITIRMMEYVENIFMVNITIIIKCLDILSAKMAEFSGSYNYYDFGFYFSNHLYLLLLL